MSDPQKRKKPPTFHHYPPDRARKLKKEWVERAKIKSKWRAQKKREDIVSLRSRKIPQEAEDQWQEHDDEHEDDKGSEELGHSDSISASAEQLGTAFGNPPGGSNEPSPPSPPSRLPNSRQNLNKQPHRKNITRDDRNYVTRNSGDDQKTSVRDLFQQAYSKSSLHTYKSDPFKRGRNHHHNQGRESSSNARGGGNNAPLRGRGQPNMKLRMNAMLAKITEQAKPQ